MHFFADAAMPAGGAEALAGLMQTLMAFMWIIAAFSIFMIICGWIIFTKASEPGWATLIPIYNAVVWLKISGKPWWWLFLYMIPFVGIIFAIMTVAGLAKNFGGGAGLTLGLLFLPFIFYPVLALGGARYQPVV